MNYHYTKDTERNMRIIAGCRKKVAAYLTEHGTIDDIAEDTKMEFLLAAVDVLVGSNYAGSDAQLKFAIGQLHFWGFGR